MSYLDDDLLPDERVVYRASLHPIIFARALVVMVVGIVGFIVVPAVPALGAALLLAGVLMRVPPFITHRTTEFGVTSKRAIVKTGGHPAAHERGLTGRPPGYGSITLTGTGGVREAFHRVRDPLELRRRIQGQVA